MGKLSNNRFTSINHILGTLINNLNNPSTVWLILVFREDIISQTQFLFLVILGILLLGLVS
ncbi:hypothetical protein C3O70_22565 [Cronobacter sakazakii]|nr:hypothetical protein C3O70_22565 [Cronobacter sakazakii]